MTAERSVDSAFAGAVLALSGGIGGAKLALGLAGLLDPGQLIVVANTGDDFEHLGFRISPDLDTLMYTLGGLSDTERGWGRRDETWTCIEALAALGGESWFQLGDGDLATHIERTRRLAGGESLSDVTASFCARLGIAARLLPMSDDPVRTEVRTPAGWLPFQTYFVKLACAARVLELRFAGCGTAKPQFDFIAALADPGLRAVIICPSNPFISIDPILAVPGVREALARSPAPVVAVSPIIGGQAVKGPTAKMMAELGIEVSAAAVARRYAGLIDGYVLDEVDSALAAECGVPVATTQTLMRTTQDKQALAAATLAMVDSLAAAKSRRRAGQSA